MLAGDSGQSRLQHNHALCPWDGTRPPEAVALEGPGPGRRVGPPPPPGSPTGLPPPPVSLLVSGGGGCLEGPVSVQGKATTKGQTPRLCSPTAPAAQ